MDFPLVQSRVLLALAGLFPTKVDDTASTDADLADNSTCNSDGGKGDTDLNAQRSKSMMQRSARDIVHEDNILKREFKKKI